METKKIYRKPELTRVRVELGVFGNYGDHDGQRDGGHHGGHHGGHGPSLLDWPTGN